MPSGHAKIFCVYLFQDIYNMVRVKTTTATEQLVRQRQLLIAQRRTAKTAPQTTQAKKQTNIPYQHPTGIDLELWLSVKYGN